MWGGRNGGLLFNGYRASILDDEVLEMDSGDGYTTVLMYLTPMSCTNG